MIFPGQAITADFLNDFCQPQTVIKPVDQSVTSSATLIDDTDLVLAVVADATYLFAAYLDYEGGTTGASDLKFAWSFPAGASLRYCPRYANPSGLTPEGNAVVVGGSVAAGSNGAGVSLAATMDGTLIVGSTAGNLQLTWAQETSDATATKMHAQSSVTLWRIT